MRAVPLGYGMTFPDVRIQDWHPLLCAKNAMNVYAGERVCHTLDLTRNPTHRNIKYSCSIIW
jgi:hypothetical protein